MRRNRRLLPYSRRVEVIDGRKVKLVTIGALANALGRSVIHVRRLIANGVIPGAPYVVGEKFPEKRGYWPAELVEKIALWAQELRIDTSNARPEDWRALSDRIEAWTNRPTTTSNFEVEEDDEPTPRKWDQIEMHGRLTKRMLAGAEADRGWVQKSPGVRTVWFGR